MPLMRNDLIGSMRLPAGTRLSLPKQFLHSFPATQKLDQKTFWKPEAGCYYC